MFAECLDAACRYAVLTRKVAAHIQANRTDVFSEGRDLGGSRPRWDSRGDAAETLN